MRKSDLVLVTPTPSGYYPKNRCLHDTDTGRVIQLPDRWPLMERLDPDDPFDEEVTTIGDIKVYYSRLGCAPMRLEYRGQHILRRVDMGQALGQNERWALHRGTQDEIEWNPNYMGALQKGDMALYGSHPLHFLSGVNPDGSHFFEGAVIPLEFDSYGGEVETHHWHGGGPDTPALHRQMRQFLRLTIDWDGRDGVHELFFASYYPRAIPYAKDTAHLFLAGMWLTDIFQKRAVVYVPNTGVHYDLNNLRLLQPKFRFEDHTRINFDFQTRETRITGKEFDPSSTPPIPTLDGIMGVNMTSDEGDISVGIVSRIHPATNGGTLTTELGVSQLRTPGLTQPLYDRNSGPRASFRSRGRARQAGWISMRLFIVTKENPDSFQHVCNKLRTDGVFDQPLPMHYVPEWVL